MSTPSDPLGAYIRTGHKLVEGWLSAGAISMITTIDAAQKAASLRGHVGEIGVHHGKLLILLYLLCRPDERAIGIDLFEEQERNLDGSGRGDQARFRRNLELNAPDAARVRVIAADSLRLGHADIFQAIGGPVRLFSVDGGHAAALTHHDLLTAASALCEGGVLILDDYFNEEWPGVSEGTNRFLSGTPPRPLVPFAIGGNKLLLTTSTTHADRYVAELSKANVAADVGRRIRVHQKTTEFFGHKVLCFHFLDLGLRHRLARTRIWTKVRQTSVGKRIRRIADRVW